MTPRNAPPICILGKRLEFPDPATAPKDYPVAIGGDLAPERLRMAYRSGLFPWSERPLTWWSPDPRAIIELGGLHISRSLRRTLRRGLYRVTWDAAFGQVMEACAQPRRDDPSGTWITPGFLGAYRALHEAGEAHSVECWDGDRLVGGIYGVHQGGLFAGESMFHRASDASKVALFHLEQRLRERGFALFDIQMLTPATAAMGAVEISRAGYLKRLRGAVASRCEFP